MSEQQPDPAADVPEVSVRSSRWPSVVWLIPIVAAAIGAWLVYDSWSKEGPSITISFATAEGLEAGKTLVKFKDVNIGLVETVTLSDDLSEVIARVSMDREAAKHLTDTSEFWVVVPRLSLKGVSGLGTLVSGAFIEMDPGKGGKPKTAFKGLSAPPVLKSDEAGKQFVLVTERLGSFSNGSPVYYRGVQVGEVLRHAFDKGERNILVYVFIKAPHDKLVHDNSRFWDTSGIQMSIDANGLTLRTDSVQSLLLGGIGFDSREDLSKAPISKAGRKFTLYRSEKDIDAVTYADKVKLILYFDGSVRGLAVGAPVEFRGIRIGSVVDIRLKFDPKTNSFRIPVLIEIEPDRVANFSAHKAQNPEAREKRLQQMIDRGFRAQLEIGSFLTGQLFVELDFHPGTPARLHGDNTQYLEIPTIPANLDELTTSVTELMKKIEKLPIDKLAAGLVRTVDGADRLINSPALQDSVVQLNSTLKHLDALAATLDDTVAPETSALIKDARTSLRSINSMVSDKSALRYDLESMLRELSLAARSIRSLASYLERNPNALIYGKQAPGGKNR